MCSFVAEFKFTIHTPSMVAAASLAAAVQGLLPARREAVMSGIFSQLNRITAVETVSVRHVITIRGVHKTCIQSVLHVLVTATVAKHGTAVSSCPHLCSPRENDTTICIRTKELKSRRNDGPRRNAG